MKKLTFLLSSLLTLNAFGWTHVASNLFGWKTKELVFHVNTANCTVPDSTLFDILDTAINAWNGITLTDLTLSRSSTISATTVDEFINGTATDTPLFLCDPDFSSHAGDPNVIPGVTMKTALETKTGHIVYSGILLNAQSSGAAELSKLSRGEIEITLAHEIGHVLGLGHSSSEDALMYYSIGNKNKAVLTSDDMDGIAHLYPRKEFNGGAFGCSAVHREGFDPNMGWFAAGLIAVLLNILLGRKILKPARLPLPAGRLP